MPLAAMAFVRAYWKLMGLGVLLLALGVQTVRLGHRSNQLERVKINLNECREGRKQDRATYEQAQRDAKAKNEAEVKRIESEQQRISHEVESDLNARLERLRSELRSRPGTAKGNSHRSEAPGTGTAPAEPADPSRVCISSEQFLLGAEYEEKLDQWVKWWRQLQVGR